MGKDKYLVNLLNAFSEKQLFFGLWIAVIGVSIAMMLQYYRKNTRRNFREPGEKGPEFPVDPRKLNGAPSPRTAVVTKKSTPPGPKGQ